MNCSEKKKEQVIKLSSKATFPSQIAQKLFNTLKNVLHLNFDCSLRSTLWFLMKTPEKSPMVSS